jgi:hypothetical protein
MPSAEPGLVRCCSSIVAVALFANTIWLEQPACRCDLRQPKIQNLGVPSLGDENVRGLDVSVDDTCDVCGIERVGDVDSDGEKDFDFQRATRDSMFQ